MGLTGMNIFKIHNQIKEKEFSSKRVLTTSWIEGFKLRDREILEQNNLVPASFIKTCVLFSHYIVIC